MRIDYLARIWAGLTGLVVCVGGCSVWEECAAAPASSASALADAAPATGDSQPLPAAAGTEAALPQVADFSPPFPHRSEFFEPPSRAQSTVRRDDQGETVELKGFVRVDQPRVVLSIDGVISPIAEGDERYGVQVISIQPPSVVLQRGRNRWTATLD